MSKATQLPHKEAFAASIGAVHIHTSAKLNKGLQEIFLELTKRLVESQKAKSVRSGGTSSGLRVGGGAVGGGGGSKGGGITFADDDDIFGNTATAKKSTCC